MENFRMFCDKYGGGIVGGLVGIALAILLFCTNLYKILLIMALILICIWAGNYYQKNKERVKELLDLGVNRVILGSVAIKNKELLKDLVREYKEKNNIPSNLNANATFYYLVDSLIEDGTLKKSDRDLEPAELQKKLNNNGYYPPILVKSFEFTDIKNKNDWLKSFV